MSAIVTDLYSTVLDQGLPAVIAAGSDGPQISITGFQIGALSAAQGATADPTATGVDNLVYTGDTSKIYYAELPDSDACLFRIVLDETIGDFTVGQIALLIGANTAFSKSVLYVAQSKTKSVLPGRFGNNISFDIVLGISNAASCINLTLLQPLYASLPEVPDETQLPAATSSIYNCYHVRNHTTLGIPCVAVRRNGVWNYAPHRPVAGAGEGVKAINPALVDASCQINMAVYFDYGSGRFYPADANNQGKFPIGVLTSSYEITQIGYIKRYTAADIWPTLITAESDLYVTAGSPGVPTSTQSYQFYGHVVDNNTVYVDFAGKMLESAVTQSSTLTGVTPLFKAHRHPAASETVDGFMSAVDKAKLDIPSSFILPGSGITITEGTGADAGVVTVASDNTLGVLITDTVDPSCKSGAPVYLQIIGTTRVWTPADPSNPNKRPEGILSDDKTRVIIKGLAYVTSAGNAWPEPLTVGTLYYAGEGTNAGTLQATGGWIIGEATDTNKILVDMQPIASVTEHTNVFNVANWLTSSNIAFVKEASPAGVYNMLLTGWNNVFLPQVEALISAINFAPYIRRDQNNENAGLGKFHFFRDTSTQNRGIMQVGGQDDTGHGGAFEMAGSVYNHYLQQATDGSSCFINAPSAEDGVYREQVIFPNTGDLNVRKIASLFGGNSSLYNALSTVAGRAITVTTDGVTIGGNGITPLHVIGVHTDGTFITGDGVSTPIILKHVATDGVTVFGDGVTAPLSAANSGPGTNVGQWILSLIQYSGSAPSPSAPAVGSTMSGSAVSGISTYSGGNNYPGGTLPGTWKVICVGSTTTPGGLSSYADTIIVWLRIA